MVEVGPDPVLLLERFGIGTVPAEAGRVEEHRRVFVVAGGHCPGHRQRVVPIIDEDGVEDDAEPHVRRIAAGARRAAADAGDRVLDQRRMRADADEDAVRDAAAHLQGARAAGGEPDRDGPVERQLSGTLGADLDLLTVE